MRKVTFLLIVYFSSFLVEPRWTNLRDINCYQQGVQHGYFSIVEEGSQKLYLATFTKLVLFVCRLSTISNDLSCKLPEELVLGINLYLENENDIELLHNWLVILLKPFEEETRRSEHPIGWAVHFLSKTEDGKSFVSLSTINHYLVQLIHACRLVTYKELINKKPNQKDRKEILQMVQITFVFSYFLLLCFVLFCFFSSFPLRDNFELENLGLILHLHSWHTCECLGRLTPKVKIRNPV